MILKEQLLVMDSKTESKGDYISISIKEPASQSASAADSSGSSSK